MRLAFGTRPSPAGAADSPLQPRAAPSSALSSALLLARGFRWRSSADQRRARIQLQGSPQSRAQTPMLPARCRHRSPPLLVLGLNSPSRVPSSSHVSHVSPSHPNCVLTSSKQPGPPPLAARLPACCCSHAARPRQQGHPGNRVLERGLAVLMRQHAEALVRRAAEDCPRQGRPAPAPQQRCPHCRAAVPRTHSRLLPLLP